jgi:hypothetical protein
VTDFEGESFFRICRKNVILVFLAKSRLNIRVASRHGYWGGPPRLIDLDNSNFMILCMAQKMLIGILSINSAHALVCAAECTEVVSPACGVKVLGLRRHERGVVPAICRRQRIEE